MVASAEDLLGQIRLIDWETSPSPPQKTNVEFIKK
jgi:hypothetical protein